LWRAWFDLSKLAALILEDRCRINADSPMSSHGEAWLDRWHVNPSLNKEYDFIDGLRGIAILMVVVCHLVYVNPASTGAIRFFGAVATEGAQGVIVFFALSGFLISWPFWRRKVKGKSGAVPPGYGWRRFWKIYPPLALSVVLLAPLYVQNYQDPTIYRLALEWLTGVALVKPVSGVLNSVMWSLVVEVHFYILLPIFFLSLKRVRAQTALWVLSLSFLIIPAACRWFYAAKGLYFGLQPQITVLFPSILDSFAFGILVAGLDSMGLMKKGWAKLGDFGLVLLAATLVFGAWLNQRGVFNPHLIKELVDWATKVSSGLLLCYVADASHPTARLLSSPWLRWCGIVSYEWYLFHQPIVLWARGSLGPAQGNVLKYTSIVGGSFIIGLIIAAVVYRYFSLPILKRGRAKHNAEQTPPKPKLATELGKVGLG
jgi:peptidoglycan/LPS O-acetylase OafA/YrhL